MGRGTDELYCPSTGYHFVQIYLKGDFLNPYLLHYAEPPPVCRLIYGIFASLDVKSIAKNGEPIFNYDLTNLRTVSVVLSSFSVAIVMLFGWENVSPFIGIAGAIIYSMIPAYLGTSQLVSQESIFSFFFNLTIYFFALLLKKHSGKKIFFFGVIVALSVMSKLTNLSFVPVMICMYIFWQIFKRKKTITLNKKYFFLFCSGLIISALFVWPTVIINPLGVILHLKTIRFSEIYSPWEWFFGFPVHVPWYYYFVQFLVRTPVLLLILFFLGIELRPRKNNWTLYILLIWFISPFLQSFILYKQHGVRYIIQVYAPFSLIVALGIDYLVGLFSKKIIYRVIIFIGVILYLSYSLLKVSPYYLDYFNELVKGVRGVYKHQLFEIGWWSNGGKEVGNYIISHAKPGSTIGYKFSALFYIETSDKFHYEQYKSGKKYDYVITSYYYYQKQDFNNPKSLKEYDQIYKNYDLVYASKVDGVPLYKVYKRNP